MPHTDVMPSTQQVALGGHTGVHTESGGLLLTTWTASATPSQVSCRLWGLWGSQPHWEKLSLLNSVGQQCFPNVVLLVADVSSHPPPKTSQGYLRSALWLEPQFERPRRSSSKSGSLSKVVATGIYRGSQLPDFDDAALVDDLALSVSVETEVFFQDAHKYLCKGRVHGHGAGSTCVAETLTTFFNFSQCGRCSLMVFALYLVVHGQRYRPTLMELHLYCPTQNCAVKQFEQESTRLASCGEARHGHRDRRRLCDASEQLLSRRTCGNIPYVGALCGTLAQGSERRAAQPRQKKQKGPPHPGQGQHSRFWYMIRWFFLEVMVEQSAETRRCVLSVVPNP